MRLLVEGEDAALVQAQAPEAARRLHCGDGSERALLLVERDEGGHVDVADSVAIGEAEQRIVLEESCHPFQPAASLRVLSGIDQRHAPGFGVAFDPFRAVGTQIKGHIGSIDKVICEEFLDHVAFVATADNEFIDAMGRIDLHQMPQDRHAADLDHGLRPVLGLLDQAGAHPTRENDCLDVRHGSCPPP